LPLARKAAADRRARLTPPFSKAIDCTPWCEGIYLRTNFSSSKLVRLLGAWTQVDAQAPRPDFAERLGLWLDVSNAITLHAAHQSIRADATKKPSDARPVRALAVDDDYHRVRAALVNAITANAAPRPAGKRLGNPPLQPEVATETDAAYAPYHQRYLDQQRQMELRIGPLRAQVRQALSRASPGLRQLATLDAVLDPMLGGRAQRLLATVPAFLEKRFEHLRQNRTPGWLAVFDREWQAALLAELDLRLQPVVGLMEALSNEVKSYQ
jgi:hypothetical protein